MRAVAVALIALVIGIAGLLTIGAAVEIVREPTCRAQNADPDANPNRDCFPGSADRRGIVAVLLVGAGGAAFGATMAGFYGAATGRRLGLFLAITALSIVLFAGAYAAVRIG